MILQEVNAIRQTLMARRELAQMTWRVRLISGCWATKGSLQCICRTWQSIISWYTFRFIFFCKVVFLLIDFRSPFERVSYLRRCNALQMSTSDAPFISIAFSFSFCILEWWSQNPRVHYNANSFISIDKFMRLRYFE